MVVQTVKNPCNVGDLASIPGLERSSGGGHGNPLQYSFLENPHGQRSLEGYSPWGRKESDMTEGLSTALSSCSAGVSHHSGFSCFRAQALGRSGLSSVQFSRSVVSDSLRPHESQHTRPPCPSPAPGVHPNSCPWSW